MIIPYMVWVFFGVGVLTGKTMVPREYGPPGTRIARIHCMVDKVELEMLSPEAAATSCSK